MNGTYLQSIARALIGLSLLLLCPAAQAQAPETMSYQGVLENEDGTPVPDDDYELTFHIYDVDSGGESLWTETHVVPVVDSAFSVILGSSDPLDLPFDDPYWLGIQVGGGPEMEPLIQLAAAPYALNVAPGRMVRKINGLTDYVTLSAGHNISINQFGNILSFSATGTGADADWIVAGDDMYPAVSGNVGIGTAAPAAELHVGSSGNTELRIDSDDIEGVLSFYGSLNGSTRDAFLRWDNDSYKLDLSANGTTPDLSVEQSTGDVGVGTTTPHGKLHVRNESLGLPPASLAGDDIVVEATDASVGIYSLSDGGVGSGISLGEIDGGSLTDKWGIYRETTMQGSGLAFTYGPNPAPMANEKRMYIDPEGRVGIGTGEPEATLDIVGSIKLSYGDGRYGKVLKSGDGGIGFWSEVRSILSVSPAKMFDSDGTNDLVFAHDGAIVVIRPTGSGDTFSDVTIPVDIPINVMGIQNNLSTLSLQYRMYDPDDEIESVAVLSLSSNGQNNTVLLGNEIPNDLGWSEQTIFAGVPGGIVGATVIRLRVHFTGSGEWNKIAIGTIALDLWN